MSELHQILSKRMGGGGMAGRKKGTNDPFANPERDLGHCWGLIFKQSIIVAERQYAGNAQALRCLDMIANMLILTYKEAYTSRLEGLQLMPQMYKELLEYGSLGRDVYGVFSGAVVQTLMCYLFTVPEMGIGLPPEIGERVDEYNGILTILSSLKDSTRKKVLAELDENGMWPRCVDYGPLLREMDNYAEVIRKDQDRRLAELEEKADV